MSRSKLRILGRYERPAALRGPLGDPMTEAGIRAGYAGAAQARSAVQAHAGIGLLSVPTVEGDTATLEHVEVVEANTGGVRAVKGRPAEVTIDIIRSGWNKSSTRFYPAEVLERDIPLTYPAGTQMYINHPSTAERDDRPERSLYDLAAVFNETPYAVREGDQVVMRVAARVYSRHREFLAEAYRDIGVSINGGGDGSISEREGRTGLVLERLTYGQSVDFVTKPGAGGRIVALLEADRPVTTLEAASLGAWLESRIHLGFTELADGLYGDGRLTRAERIAASSAVGDALAAFVRAVEDKAPALYSRDRWSTPDNADADTREAVTREAATEVQREALQRAIRGAYGGEKRYAYIDDFDPDAGVVWFSASTDDEPSKTWQQSYTRTQDGTATLTGDRVEVTRRTVFVPVAPVATTETDRPAGTPELAEPVGGAPQIPAAPGAGSGPAESTTSQTPDGSVPAGSTADEATNAKETAMTDTTVKDAAAREADEAVRTREALELAQYRQYGRAVDLLATKLAESSLPATAQNRIRAEFPATSLPLTESDRALDTTAFVRTVEAAIKAESTYVAGILEAAGVGKVTGNGAAPGAGSGVPAGYAQAGQTTTGGGGVLFGAPLGTPLGGSAQVVLSEADQAQSAQLRESLIKQYVKRGMTREAAEQAVDAY